MNQEKITVINWLKQLYDSLGRRFFRTKNIRERGGDARTVSNSIAVAKSTMVIFKQEKIRGIKENNYNIIACGSSRGGTSSVGILLRYFGFNMGEHLHEYTHEDLEFVDAALTGGVNEIIHIIKKRNACTPGWALKLPAALTELKIFDDYVERPLFMIILRNPLSIARSLVAREENFFSGTIEDYLSGLDHARFFINGLGELRNINAPFILCEYEKILSAPDVFVEELTEVLEIDASPESKAYATNLIRQPKYTKLPEEVKK